MQKDNESESGKHELSVCDIMKEDTSEVIRKMESKMPSVFQNYSNLYTEYLHMLDDIFGTCYIAEKEIFDKLGINQGILKQFKKSSESMKNSYIETIDRTAKLFDEYVQMQISAIKSFDGYVHVIMDSYSKMLLQFKSQQPLKVDFGK